MGDLWTCPYCNRPCTIGSNDIRLMRAHTEISEEYGYYFSTVTVIVCPNHKCRKQTISMGIRNSANETIYSWNLLPESEAKPFPNYIPEQL